MRRLPERIELKTREQLALMRRAGLVVAEALAAMKAAAVPGASTADLDDVAREVLARHGATSNFLNYHGYPATVCTSVNDRIVHGIPSRDERLREGDLVSIDFGAIVEGWHGDSAISVAVGEVAPEVAALSAACEAAMWDGLAAAHAGARLTDISHAVETSIRRAGKYGIVAEYGGHGIGSAMHMAPHILNYGRPGKGPKLEAGMALAIEPMITLGRRETQELDDGWTVTTVDGSWAAHWEHTVAILDDGPWVLTAVDGGRDELERRGVAVSAAAA
ncbi:MAG: type I methionyl aminopeptidase [Jatrophihabitans sp.]|uniref:type I methionyl aminopeptidase n=1 Tax=Jatrophihabitans sp. TaxID=1932789 RepID=UPI003F7FBA5D